MITSYSQAVAVQTRRRKAGLKGVAKAVRRWFTREYGLPALACHGGIEALGVREALVDNFDGCRSFEETYLEKPK